MKTSFVTNFNNRKLVNMNQHADHLNKTKLKIKRLLRIQPLTTFASVDWSLEFSEVYLGNIHKYLKNILGFHYDQQALEKQIANTLLHESLHIALSWTGGNTEKNCTFAEKIIEADLTQVGK